MLSWRLEGSIIGTAMNENEQIIEGDSRINAIQYGKNFCKYCGKELQEGAAFCSSCGKPQGNTPAQQVAKPVLQQPINFASPYMPAGFYQQPQPAMSNSASNSTTTVVVEGGRSNGLGTAGFIIALLGLVFCWVPFVDFILWFLGLIFSFIGMFKSPRGLAIAGFILSFVVIIAIISIMGSLAAALSSLK